MKASAKWKPLLICPNAEISGELSLALASVTAARPVLLNSYPPRKTLLEVVAAEAPNVCFVDIGSDQPVASSLVEELASLKDHPPVIAVHTASDPDLILRSLRQGASEFLFQPFAEDQLRAALERLAKLRAESESQQNLGTIYCVMPGKGACGATTLACNLAFGMRRQADQKVLLADLDPLTGTLAFLLKLKNNYSFLEALHHSHELDEDIWRAIVTPCQGVDVLLSPEMPIDVISDQQDATAIVEYAREHYHTAVLDTQGPYGDWGLTVARLCDELLIVTTNELPALHCTQKALSYLEQQGVDRSKVKLIVNRYNPDVGLGRETIETALHEEVFHLLPSDYDSVQKALMDGKAVPSGTKLGRSIGELCDRLTGVETPNHKKKLLSSLFSLLDGEAS